MLITILKGLEPYEGKLSSTVLRGAIYGNVDSLLDPLLIDFLGIHGQEIVADNPYIQKSSSRKKGCQIDYLIQTNQRNLFVCEFKFNRREIGQEIIPTMKDKLKAFSVPRGFAKIPVLFHLGDISESVYSSNYFYRIIDISDFFHK